MNQRKRTAIPSQAVTDDGDDIEPSQQDGAYTQGSQFAELTAEESSQFTSLIANYFLAAECKKLPLKRSEIAKLIPREHSRKVSLLIPVASDILQRVYGYRIHELRSQKNLYILVNELHGVASKESLRIDDGTNLLLLVLTFIFMSGGCLPEAALWQALKKLRVDLDGREEHPVFYNVDKLINKEFVRQCYLEVGVNKGLEPPVKEYRWGERAHLEVSKKQILEFVCQVYNDGRQPQMFVDQWKVVDGNSNVSAMKNGEDEPMPGPSQSDSQGSPVPGTSQDVDRKPSRSSRRVR